MKRAVIQPILGASFVVLAAGGASALPASANLSKALDEISIGETVQLRGGRSFGGGSFRVNSGGNSFNVQVNRTNTGNFRVQITPNGGFNRPTGTTSTTSGRSPQPNLSNLSDIARGSRIKF